jgi:L-arabinose transport system permease protein
MTSLKKLLLGEQGLVVIFAVAFAIVALTVPNFLTERNMLGLLTFLSAPPSPFPA